MPIFKRLFSAMLLSIALVTSAHAAPPRVGEMAPDFELTLVDGSQVRLSDLRGEVVVLNFWATWCVPCRTELPTLDGFYRVRRQNGLRVFAITTEDSLPLRRLQGLFSAMSIPAVRRMRGPYRELVGLPTNYIIDRNGRVRYAQSGALDLDSMNEIMNEIIIPLLREPAPTAN